MPDRMDLIKEETPIPVIKGTDYARQFAIRKRIETAKTDNTGPYSSLFDWRKEEADLKDFQDKRQKAQQKIMRTNTLGDAFRVLIESVGAMAGGTILARNPNPSTLNAVNEYSKNDLDYFNRLEGVKAKKLAAGTADLQYKLQQDALSVEKAEKKEETSRLEARQAEKELDTFIREMRLQENLYRLRGKEAEAEDARKKAQLGEQTLSEIMIARKKEEYARGMGLEGVADPNDIDVLTPPRKGDTKSFKFITPDTKKTITIPIELQNYIRTQLQQGKNKNDPNVPQVLRDAMKNEAIKPESLATVFSENWDYIRDNILPPRAYNQIYGGTTEEEPASPSSQKGTSQTFTTPKLQQNEDGTVDIDESTKAQLYSRAYEILNATSNKKNPAKEEKEKLNKLIELVMSTYNAAGAEMSNNDAFPHAQAFMKKWREDNKAVK